MKIERSKNAGRNIVFGTFLKLYEILLPFIMRTVIMYELGVKYLGLNSLFTSILQVLNLAELGVGNAMVFSMYRPIAEDNASKIRAYLCLYKKYYRIIGGVILVIGLSITPLVPKLIRDDVPKGMNVYILYLLNLLATVLTYWLFSYRKSLLQAHQRTDVISKVTIVTNTIMYASQILVLVLFQNYYYFVIAILATQVMNNVATAIISKKMYPDYDPYGDLEKEEIDNLNQRIKDLFTSKFGGTIVSSADTIVISGFLGLKILAIYQNYFYIMNAVTGFMGIIYTSVLAGVGNSMIVKSVEKNRKEFYTFTFLFSWLCAICVSCFLVLYQPFMKLWMGKKMLLNGKMIVLFCIYFWTYELVKMMSVYKDAGGIWHQDRFRPLIAGIVNLVINVSVVKFIGLYGIVLSTIISIIFINIPWIVKNIFEYIFKTSPKKYFLSLLNYTLGITLIAVISYFATNFIRGEGIIIIGIKGIITVLISSIFFAIIYFKSESFKPAKKLLLKLLHLNKLIK